MKWYESFRRDFFARNLGIGTAAATISVWNERVLTFWKNLTDAFATRCIPYLTFGARSCRNTSLDTGTSLGILVVSRQANDAFALTGTSIAVEVLVGSTLQHLATLTSTNWIWLVSVKRIYFAAIVTALNALTGTSFIVVVGKRTSACETA